MTMKAVITAIKTRLKSKITYVRDRDIVVVEALELLPESVKFPAIGIKDGDEDFNVETADQSDWTGTVEIYGYVSLAKPEASIMGDTAASRKGVLDLITDIKTNLDNYSLGGIVDVAEAVSAGASETLGNEREAIQVKRLTLQYKTFD